MNASFRTNDAFAELNRLQRVLDQVFRGPETSSIRALSGATFPVINVGSTPDTVEVMALAPGVDAASLQITIEKGLLAIAGERASPVPPGADRVSVYAQERYSGKFRRVISLPDDVDPGKVDARLKDGLLRVTLHKRESSKPRRIEVN